MSNVIDLSARRAARALPPENIRSLDLLVTGRQRASRSRNPLRYHYNQAAMAVVVAGKLHRGEPLRVDDGWLDEIKCLRKGAQAARFLADELARIVEEEC
ncbi:hypothetical protein [Bradyrhizobium sp. UNPA324]|uniref:hypothetical protein n=1 Tax=Bradyrhizobium sp. UNPA324 TaxID=1141174 RepID=UPI001154BF1B|nr:hypothetical protein [Bradyrhizobium sp. UNPA324]TQF28793.1 hypothetical protein UNPA324_03355 [Bradyrhizobium sp. UNPA324]